MAERQADSPLEIFAIIHSALGNIPRVREQYGVQFPVKTDIGRLLIMAELEYQSLKKYFDPDGEIEKCFVRCLLNKLDSGTFDALRKIGIPLDLKGFKNSLEVLKISNCVIN